MCVVHKHLVTCNYHKTIYYDSCYSQCLNIFTSVRREHTQTPRRVKRWKCLEFPPIRKYTSAKPSLTTGKQTLLWPTSLHRQVTKSFTNGAEKTQSIRLVLANTPPPSALLYSCVCYALDGLRRIRYSSSLPTQPFCSLLSAWGRRGGKYDVIESSIRVQTQCVM